MEIEDRIKDDRYVHYIYYEHLGWWKKNRFVNFYLERVKNGVPFHEVIATWNSFAKYPEDTVYIVSKSTQCCSKGDTCCQLPLSDE